MIRISYQYLKKMMDGNISLKGTIRTIFALIPKKNRQKYLVLCQAYQPDMSYMNQKT